MTADLLQSIGLLLLSIGMLLQIRAHRRLEERVAAVEKLGVAWGRLAQSIVKTHHHHHD